MLLLLAGVFAQVNHPLTFPPPAKRYRLEAPLPAISAVTLDTYQDGMGIAQQTARAKGLQGRMLWIDGTANLDRVSSEEKIQSLVAKIAGSGFNTIVFDIKPISGQVLYESAISPKIEEWKGQHLPKDFDPVPAMVREAHAKGLQILVSMNAFSEGHSLFKVGPGYSEKEHQTVVYTPHPTVVAGGETFAISAGPVEDGVWAQTSGTFAGGGGKVAGSQLAGSSSACGGAADATSFGLATFPSDFVCHSRGCDDFPIWDMKKARRDRREDPSPGSPELTDPSRRGSGDGLWGSRKGCRQDRKPPRAGLVQGAVWVPGSLLAATDSGDGEGDDVVIAVNASGRVVPGNTAPAGGCLLIGRGRVGQKLRDHAPIGARVTFETSASFDPISDHPELQYPLMMNPGDPWVQDHALAIVKEVLAKYQVDGMLYDDRLRFAGIYADFSQASRDAFDRYVGEKLNWPDDVFRFTLSPHMVRGVAPGQYYDAWATWRTLQMRNWVARVRETAKSVRPAAAFGVYGGSWFGDYHALGSDYAAPSADSGFWFMTPKYQKTGFAPLLDILVTGCYYQTATIAEAMERAKPIGPTVEAAGQLSNSLANDQCWTYAGIELENFKSDPDGLQNALQAACGATQGVMVFDLSHDIEPMWPVFKRAFSLAAKPPLAFPKVLAQVRKLRASYDRMGARARPVPLNSGASGTGF